MYRLTLSPLNSCVDGRRDNSSCFEFYINQNPLAHYISQKLTKLFLKPITITILLLA